MFAWVLMTGSWASADKVEGVDFPALMKVGPQELVLNGVGLRKVYKFGFPIKVYVGGLYLVRKAASLEAIEQQKEPKVITLQFLLRVGKDDIAKGYSEGYKKNCGSTCDATSRQLSELTDSTVDMLKGSTTTLTFYPDKVDVEFNGRKAVKKTISGAEFSKNLLAVFLGTPPNPELKEGMLGAIKK